MGPIARMLGRVRPPWCPRCRSAPGPDCPDTSRTPKQVRRAEQRQAQTEVAEALHDNGPAFLSPARVEAEPQTRRLFGEDLLHELNRAHPQPPQR